MSILIEEQEILQCREMGKAYSEGGIMFYILIAVLYVSVIFIMAVVNSQHIGYDIPQKRSRMQNHKKSIAMDKIKKTRSMWDE